MKKRDEPIRTPRPQGITNLCQDYNASISPKHKKKLKDRIINIYLNNYIASGFTLNGSPLDIPSLALLLNLKPESIIRRITKVSSQLSGLLDENKLPEIARGLLAQALNFALADRGRVLEQFGTLRAAQGAKYVPFLTPELNKILKTLIDSQKPLMDVINAMTPSSGITVAVQNNNVGHQTNIQAIGTEEALSLIQKNRDLDLLTDDEAKQGLHQAHHLKGLPEVVATKQQGFRLDAEASSALAKDIIDITPKHEDRNEQDGTILD